MQGEMGDGRPLRVQKVVGGGDIPAGPFPPSLTRPGELAICAKAAAHAMFDAGLKIRPLIPILSQVFLPNYAVHI